MSTAKMSQHQHLTGLTLQEVEESRIKHGANILTPPKRTPLWKLFLEKFGDPIIIILLLAGFCSLGLRILWTATRLHSIL